MDIKEKIEKLEAKRARFARELSQLKAKNNKEQRTAEAHLKIVAGGYFLSLLKKMNDEAAEKHIAKFLKDVKNEKSLEILKDIPQKKQ
jgi:hypothetical protein